MDKRTLLKEVGVGLLFGSLLTWGFLGLDFKVLVLGITGLLMVVLGVACGKEEDEELQKG